MAVAGRANTGEWESLAVMSRDLLELTPMTIFRGRGTVQWSSSLYYGSPSTLSVKASARIHQLRFSLDDINPQRTKFFDIQLELSVE